MAFQNSTGGGLDGFMIQFNNNSLGVVPASQQIPVQLRPGGESSVAVPLNRSQAMVQPAAGRTLQVQKPLKPKHLNFVVQSCLFPLSGLIM